MNLVWGGRVLRAQSALSWAQLVGCPGAAKLHPTREAWLHTNQITVLSKMSSLSEKKMCLFLVCLCWCATVASLLNLHFSKPSIEMWICGFDLIICTGQWIWRWFGSHHKCICCATGLRRLKFNIYPGCCLSRLKLTSELTLLVHMLSMRWR